MIVIWFNEDVITMWIPRTSRRLWEHQQQQPNSVH